MQFPQRRLGYISPPREKAGIVGPGFEEEWCDDGRRIRERRGCAEMGGGVRE